MYSLSERKIHDILNDVMVRVTKKMADIDMRPGEAVPAEDVYTVYTTLEGECDANLTMCAEKPFLERLAQQVLFEKDVGMQDVEDVAKEYFNVICGLMISQMHPLIRRPTRFQIPTFCKGVYEFEETIGHTCVLEYTGQEGERVRLVLKRSVPQH